ncbi:MAG: FHA domain-containing protein [Deltaproteobacteria bacterium]|nr:FHA domain-containing protein [Deltaproteobacteria bacterium]
MRATLAALALVLLLPAAAEAQDQGLRLVGVEQLPEPGHARVRAEVLDPAIDQALGGAPSGSELRVSLDDGQASVVSVKRAQDLGLRTHTVVAVDHSGSFKKWGYADPAWAFVEAVGASLSAGDSVALSLFSETVNAYPVRSSASGLAPDLSAAKAADWGVITRLHNALIQAVDEVAGENPGGFNRIYVLTDGDEESTTYAWQDVARLAAAKGVQIHVVIYPPDMKRLSKDDLARLPTRLDDLRALANATGGAAHEHDAAAPDATLALAAAWDARGKNALAIETSLCGMSRDSSDNVLHLDFAPGGGPRTAWTDGFSFAEWGSDQLFAACPGTQVAEATPAPAPPPAKAKTPWWVWAIIATLAVLLLLALVFGMRRAGQTEVRVTTEAPAPPPPTPPPAPEVASVAPVTPPTPAAAASAPRQADSPLPWDLPRTFLEVVGGGQWLKDPRYAVFKRELHIGGDAGKGVDLFVDHPGVSGHHCTVQLFPRGDVWVRDENSSNGTFVDGERVPTGGKRRVEMGSEIRLGSEIRFRLARPDGPRASASPAEREAGSERGPVTPAPAPRRTPKKTRILE